MHEERNSDIHLRPRFKMNFEESYDEILNKFKNNLKKSDCKYCSKIVDGHVVIDVPQDEDHFWSPQLNLEVESVAEGRSIVKGLFGPKPNVWTLFMFFHFAVAVAFIGFSIMAYVQWTLGSDFGFALTLVIALPVVWVIMYFLGRWGRSRGHKQMDELHTFMMDTLEG